MKRHYTCSGSAVAMDRTAWTDLRGRTSHIPSLHTITTYTVLKYIAYYPHYWPCIILSVPLHFYTTPPHHTTTYTGPHYTTSLHSVYASLYMQRQSAHASLQSTHGSYRYWIPFWFKSLSAPLPWSSPTAPFSSRRSRTWPGGRRWAACSASSRPASPLTSRFLRSSKPTVSDDTCAAGHFVTL